MHEFSIAEAIYELAHRATPAGAVLRGVKVLAGPMRCIDREAMELAWEALTRARQAGAVALDLWLPPWRLHCACCGRDWDSDAPDSPCACGSGQAAPVGGDELQLLSIEVDDPPPTGSDDGDPGC